MCGSEYLATDFDIARGKYKKCKSCGRKKSDRYIKKSRMCEKHGEYFSCDFDWDRGCRCPKCRVDKLTEGRLGYVPELPDFVWEDISKKDEERLRNRDFRPDKDKLTWMCPIHGEYEMLFTNHVYMKDKKRRCGCPKCVSGGFRSKMELQIEEFCVEQGWSLGPRRGILPEKMEIDIYLKDLGVGIEVDGEAWHTEGTYDLYGRYIPYGYHAHKDEEALKLGIRILHITDKEWNTRKENEETKQKIIKFVEERK